MSATTYFQFLQLCSGSLAPNHGSAGAGVGEGEHPWWAVLGAPQAVSATYLTSHPRTSGLVLADIYTRRGTRLSGIPW